MPTMGEAAASFQSEFNSIIMDLGYNLTAADEGKTFGDLIPEMTGPRAAEPVITAHITPRVGSPDPPDCRLFVRIRKRLLPELYKGYNICPIYG